MLDTICIYKCVFLHLFVVLFVHQVLVSAGKEPPCFLQLFQGGLIIYKGSRENSANSTGTKIYFFLIYF